MNSDEQFSDNVDKQMLNQQVHENVIVPTQNKIQKGQFLLPFFLSELKIFNEVFNECSMKFPFEITPSNALDDDILLSEEYNKMYSKKNTH